MIIIAHLALFALLYAVGLPVLAAHGSDVGFGGGLVAMLLMTVASEAVVIAGAVVGRQITLALKINPLLKRRLAEGISQAAIGVMLCGFFCTTSFLFPSVISVSVIWAVLFAGFACAVLEGMVRVKRGLIARTYR
ncbi:MAG: hypothetical protein SGJ27_12890 [Candidatus Melainabacteria bacterium]|nr:hypothetical protein [Candidatus Melainabacteria bacterium]